MKKETKLYQRAMTRELKANEYKGHWDRLGNSDKLLHELTQHVEKLRNIVNTRNADVAKSEKPSEWLENRILEFAADVGNCAMFVADNLGVLTSEVAKRREAEPNFVENSYERGRL